MISMICMTYSHYSSTVHSTVHHPDLPGRADRSIPDLYDLYDLYDLAHVAGWEPYNLRDIGHASWVESVLYKLCTNLSQQPVRN